MQQLRWIVAVLFIVISHCLAQDEYCGFLNKHKIYDVLNGLVGLQRSPEIVLTLTDETLTNSTVEELRQIHDKFAKSASKSIQCLLTGPMSSQLKSTIFKIANHHPGLFEIDQAEKNNSDAVWSGFFNGKVPEYYSKFVNSTSPSTVWNTWVLNLWTDNNKSNSQQLKNALSESNDLAAALTSATIQYFLRVSRSFFYEQSNLNGERRNPHNLYKLMQNKLMIIEDYIIANLNTELNLSVPKTCKPLINNWKFIYTNGSKWSKFYPVKRHHHAISGGTVHTINFQVEIGDGIEVAFASGSTETDMLFKINIREVHHDPISSLSVLSLAHNHDSTVYNVLVNPGDVGSHISISWEYGPMGNVTVRDYQRTVVLHHGDQRLNRLSHFAVRSTNNSKRWDMKSNVFQHNRDDFFWCPVNTPPSKVSPHTIQVDGDHQNWYICRTEHSIKPCLEKDWSHLGVISVIYGSTDRQIAAWVPPEDGDQELYVTLSFGDIYPVFMCAGTVNGAYTYGVRYPWFNHCTITVEKTNSNDYEVYKDFTTTYQILKVVAP